MLFPTTLLPFVDTRISIVCSLPEGESSVEITEEFPGIAGGCRRDGNGRCGETAEHDCECATALGQCALRCQQAAGTYSYPPCHATRHLILPCLGATIFPKEVEIHTYFLHCVVMLPLLLCVCVCVRAVLCVGVFVCLCKPSWCRYFCVVSMSAGHY